jgi:hypothetical protein
MYCYFFGIYLISVWRFGLLLLFYVLIFICRFCLLLCPLFYSISLIEFMKVSTMGMRNFILL